ncbi:MAG: metallopeptidase TldD-related protein [Acidimicrobiales bacterium]
MNNHMATGPGLAERVLTDAPTSGRIAIVEESFEAELRYANNTVTTNGVRRDRTVTVIGFDARPGGVAVGVASGSGALGVGDLVAAADDDAKRAAVADDAASLVAPGVGEPEMLAAGNFAALPEETDLAVLNPVVEQLAEVFGRAEAEGRVIAGFARHRVTTTYLASTTGLRRRFAMADGRVEFVARSLDGSRSSWAGAGTNSFDDVDLGALEQRILKGLSWAERKLELPAGRYETILPPDAVADLVIMIASAASGREAEEGRNVFSAPSGCTRVGERLSPLGFDLHGDPFDPRFETASWLTAGASSADVSVFDNGMAVDRVTLVENGVLQRLHYHRAGAARSGENAQFTPPVGNLVLELPGAQSTLDDLVARTERGLLVTCLWYIRPVDQATLLLTGLTRDGVYLVENGEVSGVVNNFRFNESPIDVLARSVEAGRSERALSREWGEWFGRTAMPPLRVAEFNMSSVSPAT